MWTTITSTQELNKTQNSVHKLQNIGKMQVLDEWRENVRKREWDNIRKRERKKKRTRVKENKRKSEREKKRRIERIEWENGKCMGNGKTREWDDENGELRMSKRENERMKKW